jgi:3-phenylpropionate/cinnamic acid dioxygenase small subunit
VQSRSIPSVDSREVEEFLYYEAALLDDRKYEEWLSLFTDKAVYWIPAGREERSPEKVTSLIYDDRPRLVRRVARLLHPAAHCQTPPSRTSHLITNVRVKELDGVEVQVDSSFALFESRLNAERTFSGRYEHKLQRGGTSWQIASKKVRLINSDSVFSNLTFLF